MNFKKVLFLFLSVGVFGVESSTESKVGYNLSLELGYLVATAPRNLLRYYNARQETYNQEDLARAILTNNSIRVKEILATNQVDINIRDEYGFTPLMIATVVGDLEIVNALLKAGADVAAKNNKNETALMWANSLGHKDIADMLRQHSAN